MVSEIKKKEVEELVKLINSYKVVGIVDMFGMPASQLQRIKKALRGSALIKMSKKSLIKLAIEKTKKEGIGELINYFGTQPALIFSNDDAFKLFKTIKKTKTPAPAREGDVAQNNIVIKAGPTPLPAGPAIGELQKLKIPAMVKDGKIHVREDTVVLKKGEVFTPEIVSLLKKLNIEPMEIMLNVTALYQDGMIFPKDILDVDEEKYRQDIINAFKNALNLSINVCYPTKENIKMLLVKAFNNAKALGINAEIYEKGVIEDLIRKAYGIANSLKMRVGI